MVKLVSIAIALSACASLSLQYGEPSPHDTDCGAVGQVGVRLRPGVFADCHRARGFVRSGLSTRPLDSRWTVIVSNEPAGWDSEFHAGMTYPETRVIALQGLDDRTLLHELAHAQDFEKGIPNRRDK